MVIPDHPEWTLKAVSIFRDRTGKTLGGRGHVPTEAEAGGLQPQAQGRLEPQRLEGRKALQTSGFRPRTVRGDVSSS